MWFWERLARWVRGRPALVEMRPGEFIDMNTPEGMKRFKEIMRGRRKMREMSRLSWEGPAPTTAEILSWLGKGEDDDY